MDNRPRLLVLRRLQKLGHSFVQYVDRF